MGSANMAPLCIAVFCALFCLSNCLPEQGTWSTTMNQHHQLAAFTKSLYNNSEIAMRVWCQAKTDTEVMVSWLLRRSPCAEEYIGIQDEKTQSVYLTLPRIMGRDYNYKMVQYIKTAELKATCTPKGDVIHIDPVYKWKREKTISADRNITVTAPQKEPVAKGKKPTEKTKKEEKPGKKKVHKRAVTKVKTAKPKSATTQSTKSAIKGKSTTQKPKMKPGKSHERPVIARNHEGGMFVLILQMRPAKAGQQFDANVTVWMKGWQGYLSATEWPLLPFYGCMCVVYVIYGIAWLILSACNWRDMLRVQFWIGGVIVLGMVEKAVFFAEYESINTTGKSVRGAVIFAEIISCAKRALARILVVIVSLGFGIVKPRLGPMLHKVLGVGALYFIIGSVEGCLRVLKPKGDQSNQVLLASIPLAVLDAGICWWIFTSLVQTTRTLRLRRNLVKLSLYRHFTNTLIFAVLASVAFMIWSIKQHKLATCITDWKELWVDDAYWHLLFSVILLVIMVLWRPTINNQRYAFSPLLDAAEDEAEEDDQVLNDAFEGMKMRGVKQVQSNGSPKQKDSAKAEEDLKWIEENIPSSVADTALPSLLDSDEEIMTTKFEMSKME